MSGIELSSLEKDTTDGDESSGGTAKGESKNQDNDILIAEGGILSGSQSLLKIDSTGAPPPFQTFTGNDYEELYGHPRRWECLDTSDFYENDHVLVMKTHSCISKVAAILVWSMSLSWFACTVWAIYLYINAESDTTSPKYYQSRLCVVVTMLNSNPIITSGVNNNSLELVCDINNVQTIPVIGNFFWIIWTFFFVIMSFFGCCAPMDRELVIEKDNDTGYISERNWNICSLICARVHCGTRRTIVEFTPSVVYIDFKREDRIDGVGGWGLTRWGLRNTTKVLNLRDLDDGAVLHTIDAHDILCCYNPKCCLKEAEFYMITLKQRLESHLRAV